MHEGNKCRGSVGGNFVIDPKCEIRNPKQSKDSKFKILFITLSNIGDVILTLPVLSGLRQNFPEARIDVVVGPRPAEIFTKDPRIQKVFIYNKHAGIRPKVDFIKRLAEERYDLAVDMRSSLIPLLIGAKKRTPLISFSRPKGGHKREHHLHKLKELGFTYTHGVDIFIDDESSFIIKRLLESKGIEEQDILIGVCPAARSPLKQWRTKGFIEVIYSLLRRGSYKIVLIGDKSQLQVSGEIKDAVKDERVIDLTGKISLKGLFALVKHLRVLLTCDSATLHIACGLGIKVVALFGPTDSEEYGPTGNGDIVIRKNLKCSPCNRASCRFNHECMSEISSEEVLAAVEKIL